ncbi:hypothetical protein HDU93_004035, partial [Gonapodya sp. JEL0774]
MDTEAAFALSMARLVSHHKISSETSTTLRSALDKLNAFFDQKARSHTLVISRIKDDLLTPLTHHRDSVIKLRRLLPKEFEKTYKPFEKENELALKARMRYETKAAEYVAASEMFRKLPSDRKLQEKVAMLRIEIDRLKEDYSESISRCHSTYNAWETSYGDICQRVEDEERRRITLIRNCLEKVIQQEVQINRDFIPAIIEKMRLVLDKIDPQVDLDNFVRESRTGQRRTELPRFHDYFNPVEEESLESARQSLPPLPTQIENVAKPRSPNPIFPELTSVNTVATEPSYKPSAARKTEESTFSPLDLTLALALGSTSGDRMSGTERPSSLANEVFEALKRTDVNFRMDLLQSDLASSRADWVSPSTTIPKTDSVVGPTGRSRSTGGEASHISEVIVHARSHSESAAEDIGGRYSGSPNKRRNP